MKKDQKQPANEQIDRQPRETPTQRKMHGGKADVDSNAEHFHGEPHLDQVDEHPGDIEEETLDRDAPYNKSYGLK